MEECKWTEDNDGNWNTSCENVFVFNHGGPSENWIRYCPFCGLEMIAREATDGK